MILCSLFLIALRTSAFFLVLLSINTGLRSFSLEYILKISLARFIDEALAITMWSNPFSKSSLNNDIACLAIASSYFSSTNSHTGWKMIGLKYPSSCARFKG